MRAVLEKEPRLIRALEALERRLGAGAFQIADHWGADHLAMGIASPSDVRTLAYVAVVAPEHYTVILEEAPVPGSELP
jgi:hypothetical protein